MKTIALLISILSILIFSACQSAATDNPTPMRSAAKESSVKEIPVKEAQAALKIRDAQFIDVRTKEEFSSGHAENSSNFPLDTLGQDLAKLDKKRPVYVICETGRRSAAGAGILNEAGFGEVYSIAGGTSAWKAAGLPIE